MCRQLAGPVGHRFDGVAVTATDDGAVTLDDGLARFDSTIYREVAAGDHTIVLLRLHAVGQQATARRWSSTAAGFGRLADSA